MGYKVVSNIKELDEVLAEKDKLTVIDFFATWCPPCKAIDPFYVQLSQQITGVNFVKVDTDQARDISLKYRIRAMPTFVFIKDNQVVQTILGARPPDILKAVSVHGASKFPGEGNTLGGSSKTPTAASASTPAPKTETKTTNA